MSQVILKNVRLSFPDLFTPRAFQPGDVAKFKATFLIKKDDPQIKTIEAAILAAATDKWKDKAKAVITSIKGNGNKYNFQDGDLKDYDGYAGHMSISASNKTRPQIVDQKKNPLVEADGKPYAGCYVNAVIDVFAYDNVSKGISASLSAVQFLRDGEVFGAGRSNSADAFDVIEDEEEAFV